MTTRVLAGLTSAALLPSLDVETYSEAGYVWNPEDGKWRPPPGVATLSGAGLSCVGAAKYAAHPTTELLTLSYDLRNGRGKCRWRPGLPAPRDLWLHVMDGGLIESHNAGFEFWIWTHVLVARHGWPPLRLEQQRCSMAKARAWGLPGALGKIADVLVADVQKDADGKRLIDKFSKPRSPTKADARLRITPADDPEDAERLYAYCDTDVDAEESVSARLPDLHPDELEWWFADQRINRLGVQVDLEAIENGIAVIEQVFARYNAELAAVTGGAVTKASEVQKLQGWCAGRGVYLDAMDEETLTAWLDKHGALGGDVVRALQIRQRCGSASVKKLYAMRNQATAAGRLHDLYLFHGARTGRATGDGPQPTNLPKGRMTVRQCPECRRHHPARSDWCTWCDAQSDGRATDWHVGAAEDVIYALDGADMHALERKFGDAFAALSGAVRSMFVAAPGHDLICSDYSAIEAVVLAELAGEQWRIDLFRAGGKIYEASGAKIQGLSYDDVVAHKVATGQHHPCRKVGKVAELAGGYQGWIGAYKAFGADEWMTDDEIKSTILAWRAASPMIVEMWGGQQRGFGYRAVPELFGLEGACVAAILNPGTVHRYRAIAYRVHDDVLYCELPSGRRIAYHRPRLRPSDRTPGTWSISYEGWNTNPKNGPTGWIRMDTWGGRLTENVVQAVARDIMRDAVIRLWKAGYRTVLHVYDEIVAEVPKGWGSLEEFERLMAVMPSWADGWPIRATDGWRGERYRK